MTVPYTDPSKERARQLNLSRGSLYRRYKGAVAALKSLSQNSLLDSLVRTQLYYMVSHLESLDSPIRKHFKFKPVTPPAPYFPTED